MGHDGLHHLAVLRIWWNRSQSMGGPLCLNDMQKVQIMRTIKETKFSLDFVCNLYPFFEIFSSTTS